ncbi:hypothetical protein ACU6U9_10975 [Pseudomonas sp. HK3]
MAYVAGTGSSILKLSKLVGAPLPVSKYPKKIDYLRLGNLGRYLDYLFAEPNVEKLLYLQDKESLATNNRLLEILAKVNDKTFRRFPMLEFILDLLIEVVCSWQFCEKVKWLFLFQRGCRIHLKGITLLIILYQYGW